MEVMDKYLQKISYLEKEIASRDEDVRLAATYGKQLLHETGQLKIQIEKLEQEKHSLQLKLDMKVKIIENQTSEIDTQKDNLNDNEEELEMLKKENSSFHRKLQEKIAENEELRKSVDELILSKNAYKERISQLEEELKTYQDQMQVSLNETYSEEFQKISYELQKCQDEKRTLLSIVNETKHNCDKLKNQEEKLTSLIESLRESLLEKDNILQSYTSIIEKTKEENVELMGTIELLKLEQIDVNRKGNSVFSEVEDRRKAVEKELLILRRKHECLQENYNVRLAEMKKLKHQMDIFLGMFSQKVDYTYMEELENSLCGAKKEIEYLTKRLADQVKTQDCLYVSPILEKIVSSDDRYGYLRALLLQSQRKVEELEKELQSQRLLKLAESDSLIQTKQQLYRSEKTAENLKGEVLKLKLKLQDLTMKPGDEKEPEPRKEMIPGFQKPKEEQELNKSLNVSGKGKGDKGHKRTPRHDEEKENNYNLFEALKNPVLMSEKKKKIREKKQVSFSAVEGIVSDISTFDISRNENLRNVTAPILQMNDGTNSCAQQ